MKIKNYNIPRETGSCTQTRLAETSVAAVDKCACGMMQLHIGSLTLRLAPSAMSELLATLGDAITENMLQKLRNKEQNPSVSLLIGKRGQA